MDKPVIIFGSGGMARAASEIFLQNEIITYGFLDDRKERHGEEINDIPVLGKTDDAGYLKLIGKKCEAFIAVDDVAFHKSLVDMLHDKRKVVPLNATHPSSILPEHISMGHGNLVNARVIIGSGVKLGSHGIFNTGVILEHGVKVGNYVQFGAGTVVNPDVEIGNEVFVGSGVTIVAGIHVGDGARIGAGSVVISDIAAGETVFGNPAKTVEA